MALLASIAGETRAVAHPHVWIDYAVTVVFDDADLKGVRMSWTFDEMYSSMLFHDYTGRPHGPLTAQDIQSLEQGAFRDTADFHYFIDATINGKAVSKVEATDFDARFEHGRMTYFFTVPLHTEDRAAQNTLDIAAFDHEFYIDFELVKSGAVVVEHGEKLAARCGPKHRRTNTTFFGPLDSIVVACSYRSAS